MQQMLRVHDDLNREMEQAERNLREGSRGFPEVARLRTIPETGEILTPLIWSQIGRLQPGRWRTVSMGF